MKKQIKLFDPVIDSKEENAIRNVLKSGYWTSGAGGIQVKRFEKKFQQYTNSKFCVTVNSGTAALHLALSLTDIKNKEVIVPAFSFVSTVHAILYNGGIPRFVDVNAKDLCMDIESVEKAINKKTRVILPVHFGGYPSNLVRLKKICKKNNLLLVEDAAHAAGTIYNKKKIGGHGDLVCFSFHPAKNLAMPGGGAITINHNRGKEFEKILESRRWCGISNRKGVLYDVSQLGWNYYMDEFAASIGLIQLSKLDSLNKRRRNIAKIYSKEIELDAKMPFNSDCCYHLFWIRVRNREKFIQKMKNVGIETGVHYRPIHKMSFYNSKQNLPITEKIGKEIVSIPIHPKLNETEIHYIVDSVNKFTS